MMAATLLNNLNRQPQRISMSPQDHNKTLTIIYSLLGGFFTLPLIASPWIIAKSIDSFPSPRRGEQILIAVAAICFVLPQALLFLSTAVMLYRKRRLGRKLGLVSAVVVLPFWPPLAIYTWWFLHSEGGKRMYGVSHPQGMVGGQSSG